MGIDVAEDADSLLAGWVERIERDLLDLKAISERRRERLLLRGIARQAGDEAVGREDRQPGVVERGKRHQRVAMGPLAPDLLGVLNGRLVTVVPVGDEELRVGELGGDGLANPSIADPPDPVDRAVVRACLAPRRLASDHGINVAPRIASVEREDRREIVAGRSHEAEPVLLWAGMRALVRAHAPRAVLRHPDAAEDAAPLAPLSIRPRVLLRERPEPGLTVGDEDPLQRPLLERLGGVLVGVAAAGVLGEVDLDDVEGRARDEALALLGVDDVVGRGDHVAERRDGREVVVERAQRQDLGHAPEPRARPGFGDVRLSCALRRQRVQSRACER